MEATMISDQRAKYHPSFAPFVAFPSDSHRLSFSPSNVLFLLAAHLPWHPIQSISDAAHTHTNTHTHC